MMRRKWFILILAVLVLATQSACASRSDSRSVSTTTRTFSRTSKTETLTLEVHPIADSVDLELYFGVTGGEVRWTLIDPEGAVRWTGTSARTLRKSRSFDTIAGEWQLEVGTEEASGKYSVQWEANGSRVGAKR